MPMLTFSCRMCVAVKPLCREETDNSFLLCLTRAICKSAKCTGVNFINSSSRVVWKVLRNVVSGLTNGPETQQSSVAESRERFCAISFRTESSGSSPSRAACCVTEGTIPCPWVLVYPG